MWTTTLSNSEYHALPSISKSGLDLIHKSPAHFKAGFSGIGNETARIGTSLHSIILEDGKDIIVGPDMDRSVKNRPAWDEWFIEHGATHPIATAGFKADDQLPEFERQTGKTVVKHSEKEKFDLMRDNARQVAGDLLDGIPESSILFEHNKISSRCRPDLINTDKHIILDLKSTRDASERGFAHSCSNYRYHVQHAFYCTGYYAEFGQWPTFFFLASDKSYPYLAAIYQLDDRAINHGINLMEQDLATYQDCMDSGHWPGYPGNRELSIPIYDEYITIDEDLFA